ATIASRLISETFGALSVSTWLVDEHGERLMRVSSTSNAEQAPSDDSIGSIAGKELNSSELIKVSRPFDLGRAKEKWARELMERSSGQFRTGGSPICVPLVGGESGAGVLGLACAVRARGYWAERARLLGGRDGLAKMHRRASGGESPEAETYRRDHGKERARGVSNHVRILDS